MKMEVQTSVTSNDASVEINTINTTANKSDEMHGAKVPSTAVPSRTQVPHTRSAEEQQPVRTMRGKLRMVGVMADLYTTLFISALNATIVATAIPTIISDLKSAAGYAWIGGAYILANTTSAPIWVKLSDIFGRKVIILSAVSLCIVAIILCAMSISMRMLIASRALQGVAGGGLMQLVFVIISDLFSMRDRSLYLGFLEAMWAVAGGIGPILGGFFTEYLSWRWIFWINLPVAATAFILLFFFLDVHNPRTPLVEGLKAIDWYGSASLLGVLAMLLLGLDFGGAIFAWKSPTVICLITFSGLMSLVFIFIERKLAKNPLIPLGIFRDRSNVASLLFGFFHDFCFVCPEYYLPLFYQSVLGRSPLLSGVLSAPLSAITGLSGIAAGIIIHRTGRYLELIYIGSALLLLGTGLLTILSASSTVPAIIGFEIVIGLGTGLLFEPALVALQAHLPQRAIATATSTAGLIRNIASCCSIVLGGVIFQNGMGDQGAELRAAGLSPRVVKDLTENSSAAVVGLLATIDDPSQKLTIRKALASSLKTVWIMCAAMAAGVAICGLLIKKRHLSDVHEETRTGINNEMRPAEGHEGRQP